ncbi:MAG: FAD-dependent oxidoreductase [Puniceicoccaceae bacterium]
MNRRDFFKKGTTGAVAASIFHVGGQGAESTGLGPRSPLRDGYVGDREADQWLELGSGKMLKPDRKKTVDFDVAVLGGGIAGMCAAVSAARNGAKTVLVQDRQVMGGNASSECRVHLNGVTHLKDGKPERETGVVEEILIHNWFNNPQESWRVWDHVLYDFVVREPNLTLMMNTQAIRAVMDGKKIKSAICWQLTTETEFTINAKVFIDCSGDGLLAATAGALYRTGREGKAEFGETYAPDKPDGWQMGSSLMIAAKDMGKPMPFTPPSFAIPFDMSKSHDGKHKRKITQYEQGYWWIEVGSEFDIIGEHEDIRHRLMGHMYGVWDYIKNSGDHPESANYALHWVANFPGRRESRRFMGDHILSEKDLTEYRHFKDTVGYGGWSLDEHNPGGIENLREPPSYFHQRFTQVYEIPFRSLYSVNVPNLMMSGRNVSVTHIALSSTRLQGTCATMGQATGTAAAMCVKMGVTPRQIAKKHIKELQQQLLRDDAFIPNHFADDPRDLARKASAFLSSPTASGDPKLLIDGVSRDYHDVVHHWESDGLPGYVMVEWEDPVTLSKVEIKCNTNVRMNMMLRNTDNGSPKFRKGVPPEMMKSLSLEARIKGKWHKLGQLTDNKRRLIKFAFDPVRATAIRINLDETYGAENARLYEVRAYES